MCTCTKSDYSLHKNELAISVAIKLLYICVLFVLMQILAKWTFEPSAAENL